MRHTCAAITICTAASLGLGFAQDIPTDTSNALATEWKAPASTLNCLRALGIYTTYTLPGSTVPLSPPDVAAAALKELLLGVPAADLPTITDLYKVAQEHADFLDMLANANTLKTQPEQEEALFAIAGGLIKTIYDTTPDGKQNLAAVQASSAQKNYYLAIYQLLKAYPADKAYADNLEILRACYKKNADRLFKLVSDRILGAKKG